MRSVMLRRLVSLLGQIAVGWSTPLAVLTSAADASPYGLAQVDTFAFNALQGNEPFHNLTAHD